MAAAFPPTEASVLAALAGSDELRRVRALDLLVRAYHRPVYMFIRLRHRVGPDDAEDLTQAFFTTALEREAFAAFDPTRARFRTFLKLLVDRFVVKSRIAERRLKRGGAVQKLSLDIGALEGEVALLEPQSETEVDALFEREWKRSVLAMTVGALEQHCAATHRESRFKVFERLVLSEERPSYAEVAAELGLKPTDVTNYLHYARKQFRVCLERTLAELTASPEEYREELAAILAA